LEELESEAAEAEAEEAAANEQGEGEGVGEREFIWPAEMGLDETSPEEYLPVVRKVGKRTNDEWTDEEGENFRLEFIPKV